MRAWHLLARRARRPSAARRRNKSSPDRRPRPPAASRRCSRGGSARRTVQRRGDAPNLQGHQLIPRIRALHGSGFVSIAMSAAARDDSCMAQTFDDDHGFAETVNFEALSRLLLQAS